MSDPLDTIKRIGEIRKHADAATDGPWAWEAVGEKSNDWIVGQATDANDRPLAGRVIQSADTVMDAVGRRVGIVEGGGNLCDPRFIASARTDIPALLDLIGEMGRMLVESEWNTDGSECDSCGSHLSCSECYRMDYQKHIDDCHRGRLIAALREDK